MKPVQPIREFITKATSFLGILMLVHCLALGQDVKFNHITTDDGLSNGNVRTILQDYQGFFWFGTEDGLQRYDGYTLVEYRYNPNDTTTISSNFILCLYEDSKKNLWIGSLDGGICWYDRKANLFRCFKNDPKDPTSITGNFVRSIYESSDGTLYVGLKEGGMSYFKIPDTIPHDIKFTNITKIYSDSVSTWVNDIVEDSDKSLLLATVGAGVHRFDPFTKAFQQVLPDTISKKAQEFMIDSKQRLWISTWGEGLYVYDKKTHRVAHHTAGPDAHQLDNNQISTVTEDAEGNFWISTDNGLTFLHYSFDPLGYCYFINYTHNDFEPTSLLSNSIKAFYIDKLNRLWVGSYHGGVNIYDKNALKFNAIRSKIWSSGSLTSNNVSGFAEDANGNLWIGTDGGGLNFVEGGIKNIRKDRFEKVDIRANGQRVIKIKCLRFDREGKLWIGTWGSGLFKYDTQTKTYIHYGIERDFSKGLLTTEVMVLMNDNLDNLWVGTYNGGLSYFIKKENRFKHFPNLTPNLHASQRSHIKAIHIDKKRRVWVTREIGGLNVYDSASRSFRRIENKILKKDITILSMYEDEDGVLWLGTDGLGLIRYHPDRQTTEIFNEGAGFANNVIYGIEKDYKTGHLWLSTNKGLSEFDPVKVISTNYNRSDGLQGNQYNPESTYRASDGTLLFGGINGMDVFVPNKVTPSPYLPEIVFTNFWLNNVETNVNDTLSPLKENIILTEHIDLDHDQNSFSIGFTMLEYSFTDRNRYAYMLEGLDDSWQNIGTERKATFTNLSPATYTLKVKASNRDGLWTLTDKKMTITIHPAWWQTWLFKISIITLFVVTAAAVVKMRINYLVKQKKKLKRKVKERTKELKQKNDELQEKIEEIIAQNEILHKQTVQIIEKNNEIQAQNEELTSQNDQIMLQRENLMIAEHKLKEINEQLEVLVEQRTKKLEETIKQLDKTVTELDRFVYSASHDLSAPLKSVLGLVQIARMEKEAERVSEYYNHIEFSVQKLDRVIKSMVEFSRNYHLDVQRTTFNFRDLVNEVLHELAFWPEARKIELKNTVPENSLIKSDNQRLKVVLHNLISNSVKYADFTKESSFIHIDLHSNGQGNTIMISDNGMGIEHDRQSRIFEMYYRATDRSHGSGLGLFIVKEIILKLGGTISVKSSLGYGSIFVINLPSETK